MTLYNYGIKMITRKCEVTAKHGGWTNYLLAGQ